VERGRLLCVDFLRPKARRPGGVRFLFHCGTVSDERLAGVRLQAEEIDDHRVAELAEALELLSGPLRRRVSASVGSERCLYLEDGRPVPGVS
jgi:8-oxo-dGTP diphosphatase